MGSGRRPGAPGAAAMQASPSLREGAWRSAPGLHTEGPDAHQVHQVTGGGLRRHPAIHY